MKVLGICGRKRHGKDTVGAMLADLGYNPVAFADPLKRIAMDIWGLSYEQCYGTDTDKETVDLRWGLSPRQIFQRLGTDVGRSIHADTWIRYTLDMIAKSSARERAAVVLDSKSRNFVSVYADWWVITDVRFPNEAEAIRAAGGKVVKVHRPGMAGDQDAHASEASVDLINPDVLFVNDGSLDNLRAKVLAEFQR